MHFPSRIVVLVVMGTGVSSFKGDPDPWSGSEFWGIGFSAIAGIGFKRSEASLQLAP
ncbi:MAG: hypothetical protein ON057_000217 [Glomeribacter sp. 1016415]|nr:hypothetical protein [Glomeribacter sp. 1016415]